MEAPQWIVWALAGVAAVAWWLAQQKLVSIESSIKDMRAEEKKERDELWKHMSKMNDRLQAHGEAIVALQTQVINLARSKL